jgi:hypothetical protein
MDKKVRFHNIIRVLYIPNNKEYINNYLNNLLWWNQDDYNKFKLSATIQIYNLMYIHKSMDYSDAKKILFQPLSYDESNFI